MAANFNAEFAKKAQSALREEFILEYPRFKLFLFKLKNLRVLCALCVKIADVAPLLMIV